MTDNHDYRVTFTANVTPKEAFDAINNPRAWWSQEIDGDTDRLGAEWRYHYLDVHKAKFRVTELVPNQKVVWHVLENQFNFIRDPREWVDTDIIFELAPKGEQTEVQFTHAGLVPTYECYEVCANAWGTYISGSLRDLMNTGKGQPNPIESVVEEAREMSQRNYTASFTVPQSPDEVYAAVNNVRGWWLDDIQGPTDQLGAEFTTRFGNIHYSVQKITELVPGKRVVWHVTDSALSFVADGSEWTGTDIVFDIARKGDRTELTFTHVGLVPPIECYTACSDAWNGYIRASLFALITKGQGEPTRAASIEG